MFNYARESQLIADVPLYGHEFKIVPIAQLRKARRNRARGSAYSDRIRSIRPSGLFRNCGFS